MNWWCTYDKIKTGRLSSRCTTTDNKPDMHGLQHIVLEAKIKRQWLVSGVSPPRSDQPYLYLPRSLSSAVSTLNPSTLPLLQTKRVQSAPSHIDGKSKIQTQTQKQWRFPGTDCPSRASAFPIWAWPRKCPSPSVWQTNRQTHKQTGKHTNKQANTQTNMVTKGSSISNNLDSQVQQYSLYNPAYPATVQFIKPARWER